MPYDIIVGRDDADKVRFGNKGLINLGKGYIQMGQYTSLSNPILMDIARSHVVLVAGKRGSGKCLHEDTLISLEDGSEIPIKELENNRQKIISLNHNLKIQQTNKTEFFSREVNKLLKIKLRSGKELKLTPEHPLLTITGWREIKDLKIGSRIATPRILTSFGNQKIPENQIKILAYLIAEGHLSNNFVLFSNFDEKIINEFKESINDFDSNLKVDIHSKEGCFRVSQKDKKYINKPIKRNDKGQFIDNNILYQKSSINKWLSDLGLYNKLSYHKFIPNEVMRLRKDLISIFLNRLFSCDGSIYSKKTSHGKVWEISYASSSEILIKQVHSLLLRFGILSKVRNKNITINSKNFRSFEIIINSVNSLKFIEEIGFFGKKQERQEIAKIEIPLKIQNTNVDTIPREVWDMYKINNWSEIGRHFNYKHPKAMRESIDYSPSRQKLLQISKIENNRSMKLLAESDIFWDEIISIELLEGNFKVYDICVPEYHNFVANGIIVHNSYTLGTIAEELSILEDEVAKNVASIIFDTMGIFWTMKYVNEKDKPLLSEWGLKPRKVPVKVFVPFGYYDYYVEKGIPVDESFALKVSELNADDWLLMFGLNIVDPIAVLIERVLSRLKQREKYDIYDIISEIEEDKISTVLEKNATASLFEAALTWGVFATNEMKETEVEDIVLSGKTSVVDLSVYNSVGAFNVRALVIGLLSRKLFSQRMLFRKKEEVESVRQGVDYLTYGTEREMPLVWIFIDEAHEFLPREGKTSATDALVQVLREGRQPGISIVLATQQPGQIHKDVMTQSDIVISHRVTSQPDLSALNEIMQTYLFDSIKKYIDGLPNLKGSAIILDDNSERIYPMRVRPRFTWHGGEAPSAIKVEKRI